MNSREQKTSIAKSGPSEIEEFLQRGEKGDALFFAKLFRGQVVYDHSTREWYIWRGNWWERDRKREIVGFVSVHLANAYLNHATIANQSRQDKLFEALLKHARALGSSRIIKNVLELAASEPDLAVTGEQWDRNPDLLAVNNGVIDLKTGKMRSGKPGDYIRSHAQTDWHGLSAPAKIWGRVLGDIFGKDAETISYLQRLMGYAISGHTHEHVLPILWGQEGCNGKTTLLEACKEVLGPDLCITVPADTLMDFQRSGEGPQPFLAQLQGKRLVWSSESRQGSKINVGLVKQLTGGDTLNVRALHSNPVMFAPTHKLFLLTNHRPHVPADDEAVWARLSLIPFVVRFVQHPARPSERKVDRNIAEKLRAEKPGILAWMVRGGLEWRKRGLRRPAKLQAVDQSYRQEEDTFGKYADERLVVRRNLMVGASAVYQDFVLWCHSWSSEAIPYGEFSQRMKNQFGESKRRKAGMFYLGVGLRV
jgi:putative DNA primase/helicase